MNGYRHASFRLVTVAALAAAAVTTLPASASKPVQKPVCNLLLDAIGDATTPPLPSDPALDILSGDIASGATTVVGVLRVKDLPAGTSLAATGSRWDLGFSVGGARYTYSFSTDVLGRSTATLTRTGGTVVKTIPVSAAANFATNEIAWSVPRSAVVELPAVPAGDPITGINAATYDSPVARTVDVATSKAVYADGAPSCVKAG